MKSCDQSHAHAASRTVDEAWGSLAGHKIVSCETIPGVGRVLLMECGWALGQDDDALVPPDTIRRQIDNRVASLQREIDDLKKIQVIDEVLGRGSQ